MTDSVGLAVFVKTPGLSRVKTRLAASIGQAKAEEFYRRSLAAIECCLSELQEAGLAQPYWAVAEEGALAHDMWRSHSKILQGEGGLGLRLARVFEELSHRHKYVLAIGGDSPQISAATIRAAIEHLQAESNLAHVVGRCHDGGFYLVGSNYCIPANVWTSIAYSSPTTADELIGLLENTGPVHALIRLSDVDTYSDLAVLVEELQREAERTSPQHDLLAWVRDLLGERCGD